MLASIALVRRRFRGKAAVSALLLSPLVIPYVVFGISLLLLFHALGIPRSILTVVIGHIVITLPYTILVLVPRLQQIDVSLEEAAYDLGASRLRTFRSITLPLILPAVVSAFLIAFTTSFDEYAVASFVVGTEATFPIYLYAALRFPSQLPRGDRGRRRRDRGLADRRRRRRGRPARRRAAARGDREPRRAAPPSEHDVCSGAQVSVTRGADLERRQHLVGEAVADDRGRHACRRGTACTCPGRRSRRSCPSSREPVLGPLASPAPIWTRSGRTATRIASPLRCPAPPGRRRRSPSPSGTTA